MFLGQPIRARIKGTTVQRSSGMPKTKHTGPFNVPPVYNGPGAPPQVGKPPREASCHFVSFPFNNTVD